MKESKFHSHGPPSVDLTEAVRALQEAAFQVWTAAMQRWERHLPTPDAAEEQFSGIRNLLKEVASLLRKA